MSPSEGWDRVGKKVTHPDLGAGTIVGLATDVTEAVSRWADGSALFLVEFSDTGWRHDPLTPITAVMRAKDLVFDE